MIPYLIQSNAKFPAELEVLTDHLALDILMEPLVTPSATSASHKWIAKMIMPTGGKRHSSELGLVTGAFTVVSSLHSFR